MGICRFTWILSGLLFIEKVYIMRVLLVDDSGTMRTIQKRCLQKLNILDVVEAEDGRQALERFANGTYDLVMTDWNMPNMDGLQLVKEIRIRDQSVPVIMITTEAERARVILAIQAGVNDYLMKPFTQDALKDKLEKWVTAANAAHE